MATKHGIVNGMEVLLKGFCTQEDNIVSLNLHSNSEIILNEMPKYLIVEPVIDNLHNPLNFPNINQRCIPIFPEEVYFYVKNDKPELSKQKSVSVKRQQFPLTPAYAMTAYKAQGKTLNKIIIDLKRPNHKLDPAYIYGALSRARCLNDVLILMEFEKDMINTKNPPDLLIEIERLKNLEEITIRQL